MTLKRGGGGGGSSKYPFTELQQNLAEEQWKELCHTTSGMQDSAEDNDAFSNWLEDKAAQIVAATDGASAQDRTKALATLREKSGLPPRPPRP